MSWRHSTQVDTGVTWSLKKSLDNTYQEQILQLTWISDKKTSLYSNGACMKNAAVHSRTPAYFSTRNSIMLISDWTILGRAEMV